MDVATIRMLGELPGDLISRGWEFVRRDSRRYQILGDVRCIAVYTRPHDPGIDDDRFTGKIHNGNVRVSTNSSHSPSWEDAYRDAIDQMRFLDSRRKDQAGK
jgi:hypothetical protein